MKHKIKLVLAITLLLLLNTQYIPTNNTSNTFTFTNEILAVKKPTVKTKYYKGTYKKQEETKTSYQSNGKKKETTVTKYNKNGKITSKVVSTYYKNGRIKQKTNYSKYGTYQSKHNWLTRKVTKYKDNNKHTVTSSKTSTRKADSKNVIQLTKCIDGDTAQFTSIGKTRFLIIDTPELSSNEKYAKEAANFTCNTLKKAKKITYAYDGNKKDNYGRTLAYIYVNGKLIQELIAKQGYVKKLYLYQKSYVHLNKIKSAIKDKYKIYNKKLSQSSNSSNNNNANVYYKNCAAVKAAGKAPIYRGQPGYGSHLDRDNDGKACEWS